MPQPPTKPEIVLARVTGEPPPARWAKRHQIVPLPLGPGRTRGLFNTDSGKLRTRLGSGWDRRSFDLWNVMCGLRAADRYFRSRGLFELRRTIGLAVEVTDVDHWRRVEPDLRAAVAALGGDRLQFVPLPMARPPELAEPPTEPASWLEERDRPPDGVCLFSGGADSFAGAVHLLDARRSPIFVSHAVGPVSGVQRRLFGELRRCFPALREDRLFQVAAHPNTRRAKRTAVPGMPFWHPRDDLQRLRSLFFFSLAAIVARAARAPEIFMCENGVVGAAIAFSPRDENPFNTKPAEPRFLRAAQRLLRAALDAPELTIRNPFQYRTKGEVLGHTAALGLRDALYATVSCWRSGNQGVRNCGQCVPCLFRQLAFDEAGLPAPPRRFAYRHPIPKQRWRSWKSDEVERLEDIRAYCRRVVDGGLPWLLAYELAVCDALDVTGGRLEGPIRSSRARRDSLAPEQVARMILRFAEATLRRLP